MDFTQGQNVITSSFVIPCIRGLRKSLESLSMTYNSRMVVAALSESLVKRIIKYESRKIFIFASTCILDPRFKLKWCSDDDEEKNTRKDNFRQVLFVWHIICNPQVQLMTRHKFAIHLSLLPRKGKKNLSSCMFSETVSASCDRLISFRLKFRHISLIPV